MAKFNAPTAVKNRTTNLAGGDAFTESPKLALVSLMLTSFVQDQFYRSEDSQVKQLRDLISQIPDREFSARAAVFARREFGMRSVSHVAAVEIGKLVRGEEWKRRFFKRIVRRPDDITEILALYLQAYGKPIPNAMKKGFGDALSSMSEYALAKYRAEGKGMSLVDAVNLCHPKHSDALKKLVAGELRATETWKAKLTQAGQLAGDEAEKARMKAEAWRELLAEKKLGYFALLRNLRNILEQAPDALNLALEQLMDGEAIKKSLVLPFRFATASEQFRNIPGADATHILVALSAAMEESLSNVPNLGGRTLVALDDSGSMTSRTGARGSMTPAKIGTMFAAVLAKRLGPNADIMLFSDNARYVNLNPGDAVLTLVDALVKNWRGSGTNFHSIFETASLPYDRIIILSDMQGWMEPSGLYSWNRNRSSLPRTSFSTYKKRHNCNPIIYSFDLQGYGTLQFPEAGVYCLAGFSEKIFDIMKLLEQDKKALIHTIESTEL